MISNDAKRHRLYFYLFISPWIIGFTLFTLYPIIASIYYSFTNYDGYNSAAFIGLGNFKELFFNDPLFWKSVKVTLYYTFLSVPLQLILSLSLAHLVNQNIPAKGFFRTALYMPSMISGVVLSLLWLWMFNAEFGFINNMLKLVGIQGPMWLLDEHWAVPALVISSLWASGAGMVIFLAALQGVPPSLKEASILDGAGRWQQFRHVTFPMISPIFLFQLIIGIIDSFQIFTQAVIMTNNGGPHYATHFYVYYLYANGFQNSKFGYASAMAWILLIMIMLLTAVILKLSKKYVYYEGGQNNE
ncbi:MAG: sugar ABC transporter permease [Clostridia bacterium]|nr:sugar ABC transporter permease [Clostridia bacterium]